MSDEPLFCRGDLGATLDNLRKKLSAKIESLAEDYVLKVNESEYIKSLVSEFTVNPLHVDEQPEIVTDYEKEITRKGHFGPVQMKVPVVDVILRFSGDAGLFACRPDTFDFNPPSGSVSGNGINCSFSIEREETAEALRTKIDTWAKSIRQYAQRQFRQIEAWNSNVENLASTTFQARKERLLKKNNLVAAIGLPIRRRDDPHGTYSVPVTRRHIRVSNPPSVSPGRFEPHPVMDEADYREVLSHLRHMSRTIERDPSAFEGFQEEQLRTQFLMHLNGAFQGQGTGETFSHKGKTDIFLPVKERAIFIAECKFWGGPASFPKIIDQLLGYLTWRESKTAILLFIRNSDIGAVCQQIPDLVSAHNSFTKREQWNEQGEFRFVLKSGRDESLPVILTIMCFHLPQTRAA